MLLFYCAGGYVIANCDLSAGVFHSSAYFNDDCVIKTD